MINILLVSLSLIFLYFNKKKINLKSQAMINQEQFFDIKLKKSICENLFTFSKGILRTASQVFDR